MLYRRLNNKRTGVIVIIMQRLYQEDLTGYVLGLAPWVHLKFAAIAEGDECYCVVDRLRGRTFRRANGEALHPDRESLEDPARTQSQLGIYKTLLGSISRRRYRWVEDSFDK